MKYNIWLRPYMPLLEERESGAVYIPQGHIKDDRLNFLDRTVYLSLCMEEQMGEAGPYGVDELVKEIKTHPDRDEDILQAFLKRTGKTIDTISDKEFKKLPSVPLTVQDVEESLKRLEGFGYIKKVED